MSILSDVADEAMKPVKTGVFIASAVLVVGGAAMAANSKTGRKFFSSVKKAITSDDTKETKPKADGKVIDVKPIEESVKEVKETPKVHETVEKTQGENNA